MPTTSQREVLEAFGRFEAGETVEVVVRRGRELMTFEAVLDPVPKRTREQQARIREMYRQKEQSEEIERFLARLGPVEFKFDSRDVLLYRYPDDKEWRALSPAVEDLLRESIEALKEGAEEPIRLRVERTSDSGFHLVPDDS